MKRVLSILLAACGLATAQDTAAIVKQGEEVFAKSCSNQYCHGTKGALGAAPRLAARGFDFAYINNTVTRGVTGTSMPAFAQGLSRGELTAVVAYVSSLNGIANVVPAAPAGPAQPKLSETAARGNELFHDSVRGFARCSTCHETGGFGLPVASPIASVPADVKALRDLKTPAVRTATMGARTMPALSVSNGSRAVIFYDLTSAAPVLRTAEPGSVGWRDGSTWQHSSVLASYNDAELTAILGYLREVVR